MLLLVAFGPILALALGLLAAPISRYASSGWNVTAPALRKGAGRVSLIPDDPVVPGPFILGLLEVLLFYGALLHSAWAAVGGWFVFKAASKWASWQHVMKLPDKVEGVDGVDYIRFRHNFSSSLLFSFLVGTLWNLIAAGAGAICTRYALPG